MKKLRLEIEALEVESFEPVARAGGRRGTVAGNIAAYQTFGCQLTELCESWDPCLDTQDTCPDTGWQQCGYSYGGTCGASPPIWFDVLCDGAALQAGGFLPPDCV
ncbi:MAG TPA: hypothetical protein VFH27_13725 [Longimicrobiaceae bacterium]|nr:hypothetical protein [Longimicrobiaceae bacterium]